MYVCMYVCMYGSCNALNRSQGLFIFSSAETLVCTWLNDSCKKPNATGKIVKFLNLFLSVLLDKLVNCNKCLDKRDKISFQVPQN